MQYHAILCNTMQYHAIPCNTMQYHAIPCNAMQYHAIPCNTMQYHAIQWNTMLYHASLRTADGAYHCPVGSIMAIFYTLYHLRVLIIHCIFFSQEPARPDLVNFLAMLIQALINTSIHNMSTPIHLQRLYFHFVKQRKYHFCALWRLLSKLSNRETFYDFNSKLDKVLPKVLSAFTPRVTERNTMIFAWKHLY